MIIAFFYGPVISLVCLSYFPFFIILVGLVGKLSKKYGFDKMQAVTKLGGYTEECLHSLKLIVSFAQEEHIIKKYKEHALECHRVSNKAGNINSFFIFAFRGGMFGYLVFSYYIATIFMEKEISNPQTGEPYKVDEIVSVTQALIISMFSSLQL